MKSIATAWLAITACCAALGAQQQQAPRRGPQIQAARCEHAPILDGVIGEQEWAGAARVSGLTEIEPFEGRTAAAETELLVLFDPSHLYLAFRCSEPEPAAMSLLQRRRDGDVSGDDRVEWVLAPAPGAGRGCWFQLSAAGSRGDALFSHQGFRVNRNWDGFWSAATRADSQGWSGEVAIPFASLAFDPSGPWGFNFERFRGAGRTTDRWAAPSRAQSLLQCGSAGTVGGFAEVEAGAGLEIKPYFKSRAAHDALSNDDDLLGSFGADLNWRVTPGLRAGFTYRTDFAETEVDELQVNLSRFPLFFPEKRDFFLEEWQYFEFGPVQTPSVQGPDLLPFHSRTIGLVAGQEVPLDGGLRLAGNHGPFGLGLLAVRTAAATVEVGGLPLGIPDRDLLVFRPTWSSGRSGFQLGGFLSSGDPVHDSAARTEGLDLRWVRPDLFDGTVGLNGYWMRSFDGFTDARDVAYGLQGSYQDDDWTVQLGLQNVGPDFRPALGFVRRTGYHKQRLIVAYEPRLSSGPVRALLFRVDPTVYLDLDNELESYRVPLQLFGLEWHSGDRLTFALVPEGDRPVLPFAPVPTSIIAAGEYDWLQGEISAETSPYRPLAASATLNGGSWYQDGDLLQMRLAADWRPSAQFRLGAAYQQSRAHLPGGDFTARIEQLSFDWLFSPALYWQNLVQSDNVSRSLGVQSRLRWIYEDSRELFLVAESGWVDDHRSLVPIASDLTFKAVWALRF